MQHRQEPHLRGFAFDLPNKPIAAPGECLNKSGRFGRVAQSLPKPLNSVVETMVKIDKGVGGPDSLLQFFAGDDLTRLFQQDLQNLKRLFLELELDPFLTQFSGPKVYFEDTEANPRLQMIEHSPSLRPTKLPVRVSDCGHFKNSLESSCGASGPGNAGQSACCRTGDQSSEPPSTQPAPGRPFPANREPRLFRRGPRRFEPQHRTLHTAVSKVPATAPRFSEPPSDGQLRRTHLRAER